MNRHKPWYVCYGHHINREQFVLPNTNDCSICSKPYGGLWASRYIGDRNISAWKLWCSDNCTPHFFSDMGYIITDVYDNERIPYTLFKLNKNARRAVINTRKDFENLLSKYQHLFKPPYDTSGINVDTRFPEYDLYTLNYEKLIKDYDCIEVTSDGIKETSEWVAFDHNCGKVLEIPSLYGWDIPTLLVLNYNVIRNIKYCYDYNFKLPED